MRVFHYWSQDKKMVTQRLLRKNAVEFRLIPERVNDFETPEELI
jgi:hypothetical protein